MIRLRNSIPVKKEKCLFFFKRLFDDVKMDVYLPDAE